MLMLYVLLSFLLSPFSLLNPPGLYFPKFNFPSMQHFGFPQREGGNGNDC